MPGDGGGGIAARLAAVRERMAAAAARAGRSPHEAQLVAVSKNFPAAAVRAALAAGQRIFGENRAQEAREKIPAVGPGPSWHFIGHLQRNKARLVAALFDVVESLDSAELAADLDRHAAEAGKRLRVLVQVKEAEEKSKGGVAPEAVPALIAAVAALPNLALEGLMLLPPAPRVPEDSRPYFARLRRLRAQWDGRHCPAGTLRELSMGMSADFEVAIEEGATLVRVGSLIFGPRP